MLNMHQALLTKGKKATTPITLANEGYKAIPGGRVVINHVGDQILEAQLIEGREDMVKVRTRNLPGIFVMCATTRIWELPSAGGR